MNAADDEPEEHADPKEPRPQESPDDRLAGRDISALPDGDASARAEHMGVDEAGASGSPGARETPRGRQNQARTSERTRAWHRALHREARDEFIVPMRTFHGSMDALMDLHELMTPLVADIERKHLISDFERMLSGLTPDQKKHVRNLLSLLRDPREEPTDDDEEDKAESDGDGAEGSEAEHFSERFNEIAEALGDKAHVILDVLALMHRGRFAPDREALLLGALLPVAIGTLEVLVAALARGYYLARPATLGDDPKFSLKDMEAFESLDDVRDEAIARRVESLVHGDLTDWVVWFSKHPGVQIESLALAYPTIFEVFQRRHIFIHNGGRVTRLYIKRMQGIGGSTPELNTPLPVDPAYLKRALDEIETVGDLLAAGVWSKCWPEQEPYAASELNDRTYDLMLDGRWEVVEKLCSIGRHFGAEATKMIFTANYFLAVKRGGRIAEVEQTIRDWDTSALALRFDFIRSDPPR
jgi:hypothetical protein